MPASRINQISDSDLRSKLVQDTKQEAASAQTAADTIHDPSELLFCQIILISMLILIYFN